MNERLLNNTDIPSNLWNSRDRLIVLPHELVDAYGSLLKDENLYQVMMDSVITDGPVGGIDDEDTKIHLATRFTGSTARIQLAVLDPKNDLAESSNIFIQIASGGKISILDIPCGAGATSVSFLCTIATLREQGLIPRQPLHVSIVSGDISNLARSYASSLLSKVRTWLESQAIYFDETSVNWDVCCQDSTSSLIFKWMEHANHCDKYVCIIANFSGFLKSSGKLNQADNQLQEIMRYTGLRRSVIAWVEPGDPTKQSSFFSNIKRKFTNCLSKWFNVPMETKYLGELYSSCNFIHPFKKVTPRLQINVVNLKATRPNEEQAHGTS